MFSPRLLLGLSMCLLSSALPAQEMPPPKHALFESEIRRIVAETGVPGAAYAIVVDGRVEVASGFGMRELGGQAPVTADTVFRVASVSKTFAAQLAAILVADGKLDWKTPLPKFAPELQLKSGSHQRIQLQHVIGQSSGLVPNAFDNLIDAGQTLQQIYPQFRTLVPSCAPGQCYGYQNILFGMSARAIEQAAGQSYDQLLAKRIFTPLGMQRASVGLDALLRESDSAKPHIRRDGQWQRAELEANYYQLPAAAGVNASAKDLAIWLIAQMGGYPETVRAADVALLTTPRVSTPKDLRRGDWKEVLSSAHYGLGWRIYRIGDEPIILHAGWVKGYVAEISYSPRLRTGLVVLLNGESGKALSQIGAGFWQREFEVQLKPVQVM
jgi:beta-lactamase class C